jgi:hypothetical protein
MTEVNTSKALVVRPSASILSDKISAAGMG